MEIIRGNRKVEVEVLTFADLKAGEAFLYSLDSISNKHDLKIKTNENSCVYLSGGMLFNKSGGETVARVNAVVHINE